MTSIFSVRIAKSNSIEYLTRLCKISKNYNITQVAFIKRIAFKEHIPKPAPYPYWKKVCNEITMILDPTSLRYDDNTKLIVVDGPPAVGKTKLCEQIAKDFGFLYMPAPTHDEIFINYYGFDIRDLNPQLPESCRFYDLKDFLRNPYYYRTASIQLGFFNMRFEQYMNALVHILATGQGVVLNRSIFTEYAFMDAMHKAGYLSDLTVKEFEMMRKNSFKFLLRPHLVIYLDASPEIIQEKIKKRGNVDEINSKVFTTKFLTDLENATKEKCLSWLSSHSHILIYDWSKEGNNIDVIQDIETLDFEEDQYKEKLQDWVFVDTDQLINFLERYQNKTYIFDYMNRKTEPIIATDMYLINDERDIQQKILETVNSEKYQPGCNPYYDKIPWITKKQSPLFCIYRRTPRDFVNCDLFKFI